MQTTVTEAVKRPLYLEAGATTRVRIDGPALVVRTAGEARRWFPLRLLSRVVSRPQVAWDGSAILALIEAGVPLFFIDKDGALAGACLGRFDDRSGLRAHLDALIAQPSWPVRYDNWRRSEERRILRHLHAAFSWPEADLRPDVARARVEWALAQALGPAWRERLHPLMGLLRSEVIGELKAMGLEPDVIAGLRGQATLAKDITALVGWALRGRVAAAPPAIDADARALIAYYERSLRPPLLPSVRRVIASLWKLRAS
jgi:hypothetical protein